MRVSVAIRATGSSAISRRQILARILQAQPGLALISVMVSRSVWDREGGGSSPPWVTIFRFPLPRESTLSFGSFPTDRIAGYDPADEGSSPSPNTISSRDRELLYTPYIPSRLHLARFVRPSTRPFQVTRPGLSLGVLIWAKGSSPFYLTISKE